MKGAPACLMVTLKARTGPRMVTVFTGPRIRRRGLNSTWRGRARNRPISPATSPELAPVRSQGSYPDVYFFLILFVLFCFWFLVGSLFLFFGFSRPYGGYHQTFSIYYIDSIIKTLGWPCSPDYGKC